MTLQEQLHANAIEADKYDDLTSETELGRHRRLASEHQARAEEYESLARQGGALGSFWLSKAKSARIIVKAELQAAGDWE